MIQYMTKHNPIRFVCLPRSSKERICKNDNVWELNTVIENGSGTVHILNWQTDGDYCKDNALHMSNDLQIIYVTFPSIIVFAEDINCVTSIKLSAKKEPSSAFSSLTKQSHLRPDKHAYGHHLSNILHSVKVFHLKCQPGWQMMYVFPQSCDYQARAPRRALTSSVPQAARRGAWGICSAMASDTRRGEAGGPVWLPDSGFCANQGQRLARRNRCG